MNQERIDYTILVTTTKKKTNSIEKRYVSHMYIMYGKLLELYSYYNRTLSSTLILMFLFVYW